MLQASNRYNEALTILLPASTPINTAFSLNIEFIRESIFLGSNKY
jgi:hypothetical protein